MSTINWNQLRPWNGSQQIAFEELCCQLASYEDMPNNSIFVRKGTPDAGVECFWALPNGEEYGWQAKYFLSPPDSSQWRQIDNSVKDALKNHPKLSKYFVCLPLDRPDARKDGKKSCLAKWNEHVEKWKKLALAEKRCVEFEYWGESQIFERLSQEKHRGRFLFWFNKELLSTQKMLDQINGVIANVGPRYTPELNIHLELSELFEFIARTDRYVLELRKNIGLLRRKMRELKANESEDYLKEIFEKITHLADNLLKQLIRLTYSPTETIDLDTLSGLFHNIKELHWECEKTIYKAKSGDFAKKHNKAAEEMPHYHSSEKHDRWLYTIREFRKAIDKLYVYIEGNEAQLAINPAMLLNGEAGSGKTHLLCDISKERISKELPTVLLLGQDFYEGDPWEQIIKQLGLNCQTKDELLGILNAAGQAARSRTLILIDAINESANKKWWENNLGGILHSVSQYPWIGIVLSIRSTYFKYMIPRHLIADRKLTYVLHKGFAGIEYKATSKFFKYYNIKQPDVPLLNPEFQNPLFLKLFCCGLKNDNKTEIPRGSQNITKVYENFIDSVNNKLSDEHFLNYDRRDKIVWKAVEGLAAKMAEKNANRISLTEAKNIVNKTFPSNGFHGSLFYYLEIEGIIAECIMYEQDTYQEAVQFSYERFSDHLVAKYLLDTHLDQKSPELSFNEGQPLLNLLNSESHWQYEGLIEAISIQIPERTGRELINLTPQFSGRHTMHQAFLDSLIWRDPQFIGTETRSLLNDYIMPQNYDETMETFITVATVENHPFNADTLHEYLLKHDMPNRDATWSIYLFYQIEENGAVDRLIDWAWSKEDKSHISENSILLAAKTLAWFLTTSQRFLRDRATKALVNLLTDHVELLPILIEAFKDADDPYIQERLYAVAYGCAMRTTDREKILVLAKYIYDTIFKHDNPPVHVLLRDYARGVIELALHYGLKINVCTEKIRPPYKSIWPSNIPSKDELEGLYSYSSGKKVNEDLRSLYHRIASSGCSDFNRYIIQSMCHYWTAHQIGKPKKLTNKDHYNSFIDSLTVKQKKAWDVFLQCQSTAFRIVLFNIDNKVSRKTQQELDTEREYENAKNTFLKSLGKKKKIIYKDFIEPYRLRQIPEDEHAMFDKSIAESYVFKRVIDLGWSPKLHSKFDNNRSSASRESKKPEKISKKYQWIAWHELLALVGDNFEYKRETWADTDTFEGPWQIYARDIDPSFVLPGNEREHWTDTHSKCWWFPVTYDSWDGTEDDSAWLRKADDLPSIEKIIQVKNKDDIIWLSMQGYYNIQEPVPPENDVYETERRNIRYMVQSCLVKKTEIDIVYNWAKPMDSLASWLPGPAENTKIFLGEYFWSPAFIFHNSPYYNHDGWTKGREGENEIPVPVHVTTDGYLHESGCYDCSIKDSVNIYLPTKKIVDDIPLSWKGREGEWYNSSGTMVAFDPSVRAKGPGCLLMRKDMLIKYLEENGYDILWAVLAEKNIIGGGWNPGEWKGRLIINGVARIINQKLCLDTNHTFQGP